MSVPAAAASSTEASAVVPARCDFTAVYDRYFSEVERWLRALGIPMGDLEDVAQEVFVIVQRKLDGFDGRNLPGWLFQIALRVARNHRRLAWFRHLFRDRIDLCFEALPGSEPGPAESLEQKEARQMLARVLAELSEKHRTALILFEIEGYSGEEIAALLQVPLDTVWTRLHHARRRFIAAAEALRCDGSRNR